MFSFFKSSKKSPVATPTNEENTQKTNDEFEIIQRNNPSPLYPSAQLPAPPAPPQTHSFNRQVNHKNYCMIMKTYC